MPALDFPNTPFTGQTFTSGSATWTYNGSRWVMANTSFTPTWPLLFQTITERNTYFSTNPPNGTRCFVRQCEWMYRTGVGWQAIPFMQGQTLVGLADANADMTWVYPIAYQSWKTGLVIASLHANNPNVMMHDPAGYDATTQIRWRTPGFAASTWRWEIAVWGFLDGYT